MQLHVRGQSNHVIECEGTETVGQIKVSYFLYKIWRFRYVKTQLTAKHTLRKTQIMRIRDELKFLHVKKQQINLNLYRLHLSLANMWGNSWFCIQDTVDKKTAENSTVQIQNT
jgi:hypothetical protein